MCGDGGGGGGRVAGQTADLSRKSTELAARKADWAATEKALRKELGFALTDAAKQRKSAAAAEQAWRQIHQRAVLFRDSATSAEAREVQLESR